MTFTHNHRAVTHTDGTPRLSRPADLKRQAGTAAMVETLTGTTLLPAGELSFVDYLAVRQQRPVAWVEIIQRNYTLGQLTGMGGVWIKTQTAVTLQKLAAVPLSTAWAGAFVIWHLADGIYFAEARQLTGEPVTAVDPRDANSNDVEPAIAVHPQRLRPMCGTSRFEQLQKSWMHTGQMDT